MIPKNTTETDKISVNILRTSGNTTISLLREKCLYSEFFWSVFSPNAGKYGPENSEYRHFSSSAQLIKTISNDLSNNFIQNFITKVAPVKQVFKKKRCDRHPKLQTNQYSKFLSKSFWNVFNSIYMWFLAAVYVVLFVSGIMFCFTALPSECLVKLKKMSRAYLIPFLS